VCLYQERKTPKNSELLADVRSRHSAAFADIKNETVMKIMSYRGEDGHPPPAGVSPQLRMLQMEAELQEQRAENADLRASVRHFLGF
jgi:hypothetical protein